MGDQDYFDPGDVTFLFYQEECGDLAFEGDYSIAYRVKNTEAPYVSPPYPGAHNRLEDPRLAGPFTGNAYGMMLSADSPAIDAGDNSVCPPTDILGVVRPLDGDGDGSALCDMGAYEWRGRVVPVYLPLLLHVR